jgi:hypothetical protein
MAKSEERLNQGIAEGDRPLLSQNTLTSAPCLQKQAGYRTALFALWRSCGFWSSKGG